MHSARNYATNACKNGKRRSWVERYVAPVPIRSDPDAWTDARHRRGLAGERAAIRFLEARGWRILDHRFRMGRLEVDVIARRDQVVSFVEVKTRGGDAFGSPLEAVGWAKRREISRVASAWVDRHGRPGDTYRFDVIGVTVSHRRTRIDHVEDAFKPGWR
jgi:putative endonuclease